MSKKVNPAAAPQNRAAATPEPASFRLAAGWRVWLAIFVLLAVAGANVFLAPSSRPFSAGNGILTDPTGAGGQYQITQIIEDEAWIEAAPVVLANHFENVRVLSVGSRQVDGLSFQRELVSIYGIDFVDTDNDPVDLRVFTEPEPGQGVGADSSQPLIDFLPVTQFAGETRCAVVPGQKYCTLLIAWDPLLTPDGSDAVFVGVRVAEQGFGLVEQQLLNRLVAEAEGMKR